MKDENIISLFIHIPVYWLNSSQFRAVIAKVLTDLYGHYYGRLIGNKLDQVLCHIPSACLTHLTQTPSAAAFSVPPRPESMFVSMTPVVTAFPCSLSFSLSDQPTCANSASYSHGSRAVVIFEPSRPQKDCRRNVQRQEAPINTTSHVVSPSLPRQFPLNPTLLLVSSEQRDWRAPWRESACCGPCHVLPTAAMQTGFTD